MFGKNTFTKEIFNGSFNSGKNPVFKPSGKVSYAIIHPIEFSIREFEKVFNSHSFPTGYGRIHRNLWTLTWEGYKKLQIGRK